MIELEIDVGQGCIGYELVVEGCGHE